MRKDTSKFNKPSRNKNRLEDHKTLAMLAQTETALAVMECAPSLGEYTTSQWSQFHSLPLHVAVKGRMEHNAAMRRMEQDKEGFMMTHRMQEATRKSRIMEEDKEGKTDDNCSDLGKIGDDE